MGDIRPGSVAEAFLSRMAELSDFSSEDVVRSCSTTVGWAASSFAAERKRVIATDVTSSSKGIKMSERKININTMLKEIENKSFSLKVTGVETWGITAAVVDQAEQAYKIMYERDSKGVLKKGKGRKSVESINIFSSSLTLEEEMALLYQIVPEEFKAEASYLASLAGAHVAKIELPAQRATLTERTRMKVAAKRLSMSVYGKNPPPIIVNSKTDTSSLMSYTVSAANADIGLGHYVVFPAKLLASTGKKAALTPQEAATKETAKKVVTDVVHASATMTIAPKIQRMSMVRDAETMSDLSLVPRNIFSHYLMPASQASFEKMAMAMASSCTLCRSTKALALASASTRTSKALRRAVKGLSLQRAGVVNLRYGTNKSRVPATINRRYINGVYLRNAACLVLKQEEPTSVSMKVDGQEREFIRDSKGYWIAKYVIRRVEKEISITIISPGETIEVFPACYPPALVARMPDTIDVAILRDLEDIIPIKKEKNYFPPFSRIKGPAIDANLLPSIERLALMLTEIPGLHKAFASMCANMKIGLVTLECVSAIADLDVSRIRSNRYADAAMTSKEILASATQHEELAILSSMLVSSFSSAFSLLTHSDEDAADVYSVIRAHSYASGMISSEDEPVATDTNLDAIHENMTAAEMLAFLSKAAEEADDLDDEIIAPDEHLADGSGESEELERLGLTKEQDNAKILSLLGISDNARTAEMVTTLPSISKTLKRYYVGPGDEKVIAKHTLSTKFVSQVSSDVAKEIAILAAKKGKTSAARITAADITNSFEGNESEFIIRALRESCLIATIISHSRFKTDIEQAREAAITACETTNLPAVIAPFGRFRTKGIKGDEIKEQGYIRIFTSYGELAKPESNVVPGDFIGQGGVVRMT
jgi:hypothetical protein